jgi:hypothetical protein
MKRDFVVHSGTSFSPAAVAAAFPPELEMNLKALSSRDLLEKTVAAAREEKRATLALLDLLAEVDARRLYSERGYATLWEYVHKALGYSEAQASERVAAMRLMRKVPEVRAELDANRVNLTATAKLASFVRREGCDVERTRTLLEKIVAKPTREVEKILLAEQAVPEEKPDRFEAKGPELTRISFDADAEFMSLFEELRNLQGRPDWSMSDRMKAAMRDAIRRKRGPEHEKKEPTKTEPNPERKTEPKKSAPVLRAPEAASTAKPSRFIPIAVRRAIRARSGNRCEYVDPTTKRRCEGRFGLQFDHIQPFAKGGGSNFENLRHLCANHNRHAAVREFGAEKMASFFDTGR